MLSSSVFTFTDPDDYADAIRAARATLTVTGRGQFRAGLVRIDLNDLWMQRYSEDLPRIVYSPKVPGRNVISFRTQPGSSLLFAGIETQLSGIIRHGGDADGFYQSSSGSAHFGTMSLPIDKIIALCAVAGCDLVAPRETLSFTPRPSAMARLQVLHATAVHLAAEVPEIIRNAGAARGLEQALIDAMVDCLSVGALDEDTAAKRHHRAIMRRFHAVIEANHNRPLFLSELCASIGVPGGLRGDVARKSWAWVPSNFCGGGGCIWPAVPCARPNLTQLRSPPLQRGWGFGNWDGSPWPTDPYSASHPR